MSLKQRKRNYIYIYIYTYIYKLASLLVSGHVTLVNLVMLSVVMYEVRPLTEQNEDQFW